MGDYLTSLVARNLEVGERLQPRIASSFEAPARLATSAESGFAAQIDDPASVSESAEVHADRDASAAETARRVDAIEAPAPEVRERLASMRGLERPARRGTRQRARPVPPHQPAVETPTHAADRPLTSVLSPAAPAVNAPAPGQSVQRSPIGVPHARAARPDAPAAASRAGSVAPPRSPQSSPRAEGAGETVFERRSANRDVASPPPHADEYTLESRAGRSAAEPLSQSTAWLPPSGGSVKASPNLPAEAGRSAVDLASGSKVQSSEETAHQPQSVASRFPRTPVHALDAWEASSSRNEAPTTVHVTIGRIEVRATPPAKPAPGAPSITAGPTGLDEYLRRRLEGSDR